MISAARDGDIEKLKRLKRKDYDFNVVDDYVSIILHMLLSTYNFTHL